MNFRRGLAVSGQSSPVFGKRAGVLEWGMVRFKLFLRLVLKRHGNVQIQHAFSLRENAFVVGFYAVRQTENSSWEYTGKGQLSEAVMVSSWSAAARAFSMAGTITS